jgi:hypothetical protein
VSEAIDFIVKLTEPYPHLFEPLLLIKLVWVQVWGLCLLNTKPIAEDVQFLLCSTKETEHLLNISYMPYNYTFQVSP